MRLLLVTHYYPEHRGGIEIVAGELARRLAKSGITIRWVASDATQASNRDEPWQRLPMRSWNFAEDHLGFPYPLWSPASLARLRSQIDWCDVVHLHDSLYLGNFLASRMARQRRKPIVVTQHIGEVPYRSPLLRGLLRIGNRTVARRVLTSADRCIFISPRVRDYFQRFVRFRAEPIYWPNGVDNDRFHPVDRAQLLERRVRFGWPFDQPVLLFVGRFVEKKGLNILRTVAQQLPDCRFAFAGWGPIDPSRWGLGNVECLGSLDAGELADRYRAADLLVLPSVGEGFPLVVQEAAACALPALISTETAQGIDGIAEFTSICDPEPASVVACLRSALVRPDELRQRKEKAAEFARRYWNWDRVAEYYRVLFEELVRHRVENHYFVPMQYRFSQVRM